MKKQIVIFVVGVVVLVIGFVAHSFVSAAGSCQKPSESTVFCYKPTNETGDCSRQPGPVCNTHSQYVINKFPKGTTVANSGTTTEEKADCFQETMCRQGREDSMKCEAYWVIPFEPGDKTVVGTGTCPEG